ncbi:MAG: hypothetical protein AAB613_03060 [Patescibacteria group bacterium]
MSTIPSESLKACVRPADEASLATIPSLGLLLAPPMAVPEVESSIIISFLNISSNWSTYVGPPAGGETDLVLIV